MLRAQIMQHARSSLLVAYTQFVFFLPTLLHSTFLSRVGRNKTSCPLIKKPDNPSKKMHDCPPNMQN